MFESEGEPTRHPVTPVSLLDQQPSDSERTSLWSLIANRLRGRWRAAILLGFLLGAGLGAAGYLLTVPKYQSVGIIRISAMHIDFGAVREIVVIRVPVTGVRAQVVFR